MDSIFIDDLYKYTTAICQVVSSLAAMVSPSVNYEASGLYHSMEAYPTMLKNASLIRFWHIIWCLWIQIETYKNKKHP